MLARTGVALLILVGYGLTLAALAPGLLVIVQHGFGQQTGPWLWAAVPASLLVSAAMLDGTLRLRHHVFGDAA